jgi:hypothetical protein
VRLEGGGGVLLEKVLESMYLQRLDNILDTLISLPVIAVYGKKGKRGRDKLLESR